MSGFRAPIRALAPSACGVPAGKGQGALFVNFLVGADAIAKLVALGWLDPEERGNRNAVIAAVIDIATRALAARHPKGLSPPTRSSPRRDLACLSERALPRRESPILRNYVADTSNRTSPTEIKIHLRQDFVIGLYSGSHGTGNPKVPEYETRSDGEKYCR
jgi:hypothetical protein